MRQPSASLLMGLALLGLTLAAGAARPRSAQAPGAPTPKEGAPKKGGDGKSPEEKEAAEKNAGRKAAALKTWASLEQGPAAVLETKHLLLVGSREAEKTLPAAGANLERYFDRACSVLQLDPARDLPPVRLVVYLVPDRDGVRTFIRRVENRSVRDEQSAMAPADEKYYVVAGATAGKLPLPNDVRAGEQLAALLLKRKGGISNPLPAWLENGFGRALTYRLSPRDKVTAAERAQAARLAKTRKPSDVFNNNLEPEETDALVGSVADFFAFGPASKFFVKFVESFKPGENEESRSTVQALESSGLKADRVEKSWKSWAPTAR